ncbi:MAG: tripartite tricarboxylate transporter substrate binding protein [Burkholderiales bacterium]|jgi:tripartite-type tricarboxylate transporter receptor subunit TctC|nr:tripartite tricarboxylate transporter substrate binding protein [Burkholderiales bacterium]
MNIASLKTMHRALQSVFVFASLFLAVSAGAQTYPSKPIRMVVPWPAGGLVDVAARQLGQRMQVALGQPVVIDNKLGAGGNLGADLVAKAPADGHTLLFTTSALTMNTALRSDMPFNTLRDFERVAVVAYAPAILVVNANSGIRTLQDLIKAARSQPGKLSYASAGIGSPAHLMSELFKSRHNIFVVHIPYTGAPAAMNDQIAGRIDFQFANAAVALPQIKAGKVRALAVTSTQRMPGLPEIPTMAEAGMNQFEIQQWLGLLAPQGTPAKVIERIVSEVNQVLALNDFSQALIGSGTSSAKPGKPADFDAYFQQDLAQWTSVVKSAKIQPE